MTSALAAPARLNDDDERRREPRSNAHRRAAKRTRRKRKPATGNWNPDWEPFAKLDPAWTEKVIAMAIAPAVSGALDAKTIELIGIALDASCTHMYAPGVRRHIQRALKAGATEQEITAVLQIASMQGLHSMCLGAPILLEELDAARQARRLTNRTQTKGNAMNFLDGSLFPENQEKLVITAAPYGPEWVPSDFPEDIPVTMEAQVQKAVDCYNAGATALHLHVRELDGKGSKRLSKFNELIAGVRKAVPDMIIQVGGSISFAPETDGADAKWLSDDTRHMLAELDPKPDQVTVTVNTTQMNVVEQMEIDDLAGTSLAEPRELPGLPRDDRPLQPELGRGARAPPERRRHPERLPVLQHQQLRDRRAPDAPRHLQGPAGDELGGDRRRHGPADDLQPGQLPARDSRRLDADGREQHAQRAADQHDGHRDGPARALRHRGQPLEPVPHGQDDHRAADRAARAHLARVRPRNRHRQGSARDLQDRRVLRHGGRDAGRQRLRPERQGPAAGLPAQGLREATMAHAIRMHETGGPEVLRWEEVAVGDPGPGPGATPARGGRPEFRRHLLPRGTLSGSAAERHRRRSGRRRRGRRRGRRRTSSPATA